MAENLGEARLRLTANSKQLESKLKTVGDKTKRLGVGFGVLGAAIATPLAAGVKIFAEYEQSMAQVQAVSGATEVEFEALDRIARQMGRTTVFTARESAQALSFMSMAGLEATESISALPDVLNLAAAGQLELGQSADIVTNVMAGYGIAADDVTRAVDVLTVGFTSANTDLVQLGEAFKLGGPVAKAAGLRFEETAAALSLMGNAGFQATLSGTALRGAIARMLNPTAEAEDILAKYGVTVLDTEGKMLPLVDIMRAFEREGLTAADAMSLFGQRAGPAMLALLEQGSGALEQLTADMDAAGGTAQRIADTQLNTLTGDITLLKSAIEGMALAVGQVLAPELRTIAQDITPVIQGIVAWSEKNPELSRRLILLAAAVAVVALVLGGLLIGVGFLAVGLAALSAGPILLGIAGLAALGAAAFALVWEWDALVAAVEKFRPALEAALGGDFQPLIDMVGATLESLQATVESYAIGMTQLWRGEWASAAEWFDSDWPMQVGATLEQLQATVESYAIGMTQLWRGEWASAAEWFASDWPMQVGATLEQLQATVEETLAPAIETAEEIFGKFEGAIDKVKTIAKSLDDLLIALGLTIAALLIPIMGPVGLVFAIGKIALKFVDVEKVWTEILLPALEAMRVWFGETIMPPLQAFSDFLGEKIPEVIGFLGEQLTGLRDSFTGLFATMGEQSEESGSMLTGVFEGLTEIFTGVWEFIRDNLIPVFLELVEFVWPLIAEVWTESLKPTFEELVEFFKNTIIPTIQELWDFFVLAWENMDATVIAILKTMAIVVEALIDAVFSVIRIALALLQGDWEQAWEEVKRFFAEIWESIGRVFEAWQTPLMEGWRNLWKAISGAIQSAVAPIKSAINNIIGFLNKLIGAWNKISFRVPSISIPSVRVPAPTLKNPFRTRSIGGGSFGGQSYSVPQISRIPHLAEGGIAMGPTLAMIGEDAPARPEVVAPLDKLAGMGGASVTINVEGSIVDVEGLADPVAEVLLLLRRQGLIGA